MGNAREYIVSDQSGMNFIARFAELGINVDKNDNCLDQLIADVKDKEYKGWAFDTAEASRIAGAAQPGWYAGIFRHRPLPRHG